MMATAQLLEGSRALVTGATRGIGRGLALALAEAGASVAVCGRDEGLLRSLEAELAANGHEVVAVVFDVTNVDATGGAIDRAVASLGGLDICVVNAGLGDNQPAFEVTEDDWDRMMAVNLKGAFFTCQAAGRHMVPNGYGRIVVMSSQAGIVGIRDHAVYTTSKGGINAMIKVLALEWAPHGVTVNAVAPTFVYTPGTAERLDDPDYLKAVVERIPAGRVATIDDVASAVVYLASPGSGMVNGTVLPVDGGWTAQ